LIFRQKFEVDIGLLFLRQSRQILYVVSTFNYCNINSSSLLIHFTFSWSFSQYLINNLHESGDKGLLLCPQGTCLWRVHLFFRTPNLCGMLFRTSLTKDACTDYWCIYQMRLYGRKCFYGSVYLCIWWPEICN
jgi:hypothetical protein